MPPKTKTTELDVVVLSPALGPHGTMRIMRRARIIGDMLEPGLSAPCWYQLFTVAGD